MAEFDDLIQEIDDNIRAARNNLQIEVYLNKEAQRLQAQYTQYNSELKNYYPYQNALDVAYTVAYDILWQEAQKAVEATREFDLPIFTERLMEAIYRPDSINLTVNGNRLNVMINLNKTAGRIDDYGNAVAQTRADMGIGGMPQTGKKTPFPASNIWRKIYRAGHDKQNIPPRNKKRANRTGIYAAQYIATIENRVANFGSLAPFWSIIDTGTPRDLVGSRGGRPYPHYGGTHFVKKATDRIKSEFNVAGQKERAKFDELKTSLTQLKEGIKYISQLYEQIGNTPLEVRTLNAIKAQLGPRLNLAKPEKIQQLLNDLLSGTAIGGMTGRVSLGRTRIRVRALQRNIGIIQGNQ